jgi:hypothetical protein
MLEYAETIQQAIAYVIAAKYRSLINANQLKMTFH